MPLTARTQRMALGAMLVAAVASHDSVVTRLVVAAAQTPSPVSRTEASRPGLAPQGEEPAASDDREQTGPAQQDLRTVPRQVLISVQWPAGPGLPDLQQPEGSTLEIPDRDVGTITRSLQGRSGELGLRPTVLDEEQGLVRIDILTKSSDRTAPYFRVEESFELLVGAQGVRSSVMSGATIAATEIRFAGTDAEVTPAAPTRRPPGDIVRAPIPGSPALASRPGPPTPALLEAVGTQSPPSVPTEPIVLRIGLPTGGAPVLTLPEGTVGTIELPDESVYGFRPTRFVPLGRRAGSPPMRRGVVRVEILDLARDLETPLGIVELDGDRAVRSPTLPAFTIAVVGPGARRGR